MPHACGIGLPSRTPHERQLREGKERPALERRAFFAFRTETGCGYSAAGSSAGASAGVSTSRAAAASAASLSAAAAAASFSFGGVGSVPLGLLGELFGTLGLLGGLGLALGLLLGLGFGDGGGTGGLLGSLALGDDVLRRSELVGEALDASAGVDELLLARVERMTGVADVDLELGLGGTRRERVAAAALHGAFHVLRMDSLLHVWFSFK